MCVTGWENCTLEEIAELLSGEEIQPVDTSGLHGAVIVLARRVAELQQRVAILESEAQRRS